MASTLRHSSTHVLSASTRILTATGSSTAHLFDALTVSSLLLARVLMLKCLRSPDRTTSRAECCGEGGSREEWTGGEEPGGL
jgi:hypothetical protein